MSATSATTSAAAKPLTPTVLVRAEADGSTAVAASDMLFPNGMVAYGNDAGGRGDARPVPDGLRHGSDDGTLSNRRIWAQLDTKTMPDGIALDQEGAIWVCSPRGDETFRVLEGGRVTHRIKVSGYAIACALGGPEGRDLLICSTKTLTVPECRAKRLSCIEHVKVDVPGGKRHERTGCVSGRGARLCRARMDRRFPCRPDAGASSRLPQQGALPPVIS